MNICRSSGADNSTWAKSGPKHKFLADNKYGRGSPPEDRVKRRALADVTDEKGNPPADGYVAEAQLVGVEVGGTVFHHLETRRHRHPS
jgi:hypothetical protein